MMKYLFLLIGLLMFIPYGVQADTSIDITSSKKNISINDTITIYVDISSDDSIGYYEYTLDYNHSKLKLTSGSSYNVNRTNDQITKKITRSFKFKALANGSSDISVKAYAVTDISNNNLKVKVNPTTISISDSDDSINDNASNYLSSLEVKNYKLTPEFDEKINDYNLVISDDVNEITIIATALNENSEIQGDGIVQVNPGDNKIEVSVKNDDGEKNVYTILVTVNDNDSIKEIIFAETTFIPLENSNIPKNYIKDTTIINGMQVDCYKLSENSEYCLIYGMNSNTGEEGWYSYYEKDNTIQKYNDGIDEYYENEIKDLQVLIYILGGTIIFFGILVIIFTIKLNQKKNLSIAKSLK